MKRYIISLIVCIFAAICIFTPVSFGIHASAAVSETYALIASSNASLLREPSEPSIENTYFVLPKTYFVTMVQSNFTTGYHKVRYRDVVGYVRTGDVDIKNYTPASIYPTTVMLKINIDADDVNLRIRPDHHTGDESIQKISCKTANVEYYNSTVGTDIMTSGNTLWYFVKINRGESVVRGYLYAGYVLLESTYPLENDTSAVIAPDVKPPLDKPDPAEDLNANTSQKLDSVKLVGIIALCVPAVAIVIIIFARPRKKKNERTEKFSS